MTKFQNPKDRYRQHNHKSLVQDNHKQHNNGPTGLPYLHKPNSSVRWNSISDVLNGSMATIDDYDDDTTTSGSYEKTTVSLSHHITRTGCQDCLAMSKQSFSISYIPLTRMMLL
jgi:hypothetical protein